MPVIRYERAAPGELLHVDTKQLGRIRAGGGHRIHGRRPGDRHQGLGWDRVHVAVDDHTRIAYSEELADEAPATTGRLPGAGGGVLRRSGEAWHSIWRRTPAPQIRAYGQQMAPAR